MTVERGEPWGRALEADDTVVDVASDQELAARLAADGEQSTGRLWRPLAGDVARSIGISGPTRPATTACPVDLGWAETEGGRWPFVAHVVARRSWLWGDVVAVMNAEYLGNWDVAPRSHPNDGWLDVVECRSMPSRQRLQARRRLLLGTHLPHPSLTSGRRREAEWEFRRALDIYVDGVTRGRAHRLRVWLHPDAGTIAV